MADNIIKLKKNSVPGAIPQVSDLYYGELALNTADGILYFKRADISGDYIEKITPDSYSPYTWNSILSGVVTTYGNNIILQPYSTILGGYQNVNDGPGSTIINGEYNNITGQLALIGGGSNNLITIDGDNSAILGGENNRIDHKNTFTLGSGLTSHANDFTYTNNISSNGIIYTETGNSNQWTDVFTTVNELSSIWNSISTTIAASSADWNSVVSSVYANSGNWDSVFATVCALSSEFATREYVYNEYFSLTGGTITGETKYTNDVTIFGKLSAIGGTYFANTVYTTTSALSVSHFGDGPALYVGQTGTGDIASFVDEDQGIEILHIGGGDGNFPNVGVKTSTPNVDFTVNGQISASGNIWTSGNFISGGQEILSIIYPDIDKGLTGYTNVQINSANWDSTFTSVKNTSANWDSVYSCVSAASASWGGTLTSPVTSDLTVGAVSAGQIFNAGTTFQFFVEKLITTIFYPTFTAPSATLTSNLASIVESGATGITLNVNLNRGLITGSLLNGIWQPSLFQNNRSGAATKYTIFDIDNGTTTAYTSANAIINDGANSFTATVDYGTGPQPLDSKNNNFNSPLAAGSISPSLTITGRRKAFYGINSAGSNSTEIRNLSSVLNPQNGTSFTIPLPIGTTSIVFAYPATLRDVTSVKESVLNSDIKSAFGTPYTVNVFGNNGYTAIPYKVYRFQPPNPIATADYSYTVTI
jgi:hypothetical protein